MSWLHRRGTADARADDGAGLPRPLTADDERGLRAAFALLTACCDATEPHRRGDAQLAELLAGAPGSRPADNAVDLAVSLQQLAMALLVAYASLLDVSAEQALQGLILRFETRRG